jgi:hypothetical protein
MQNAKVKNLPASGGQEIAESQGDDFLNFTFYTLHFAFEKVALRGPQSRTSPLLGASQNSI